LNCIFWILQLSIKR